MYNTSYVSEQDGRPHLGGHETTYQPQWAATEMSRPTAGGQPTAGGPNFRIDQQTAIYATSVESMKMRRNRARLIALVSVTAVFIVLVLSLTLIFAAAGLLSPDSDKDSNDSETSDSGATANDGNIDLNDTFYFNFSTFEPTSFPSLPTTLPTTLPTGFPTNFPTDSPSVQPSTDPTTQPSFVPTVLPSAEPSAGPSKAPTPEPTDKPTVSPTDAPTPEPSDEPSPNPSPAPTFSPTSEPTLKPTARPSDEPTVRPIDPPTKSPSPAPTEEPSFSPSNAPSPGTPPGTSPGTSESPGATTTDMYTWRVYNLSLAIHGGKDHYGLHNNNRAVNFMVQGENKTWSDAIEADGFKEQNTTYTFSENMTNVGDAVKLAVFSLLTDDLHLTGIGVDGNFVEWDSNIRLEIQDKSIIDACSFIIANVLNNTYINGAGDYRNGGCPPEYSFFTLGGQ